MLNLLSQAEQLLPDLLQKPEIWNSVYVDYHPPIVERLWTQWGQNRIYLHKIYPCNEGESLLHPHPWPQAAKVLSGKYEMGVGYSTDPQVTPPYAAKIIVTAGSSYEMVEPAGWHYVRPLDEPSLSIMVTGLPWENAVDLKEKPTKPLESLKDMVKEELLNSFKKIYL